MVSVPADRGIEGTSTARCRRHVRNRMRLLPASLGRHVRLLEESLGTRLMIRTTRSVSLTEDGAALLEEVRPLLNRMQELAENFRSKKTQQATVLRIGAIDSAAAGLIPQLLHDFREKSPTVVTQLVEDKSIRLIPKLIAGRLDIVFIRPRDGLSRNLAVRTLLHETAVVALPSAHVLAIREHISVKDLGDEPLIVLDRRSRPHSYDLTMKLFEEAGMYPRIAQIADDHQPRRRRFRFRDRATLDFQTGGVGRDIRPTRGDHQCIAPKTAARRGLDQGGS